MAVPTRKSKAARVKSDFRTVRSAYALFAESLQAKAHTADRKLCCLLWDSLFLPAQMLQVTDSALFSSCAVKIVFLLAGFEILFELLGKV